MIHCRGCGHPIHHTPPLRPNPAAVQEISRRASVAMRPGAAGVLVFAAALLSACAANPPACDDAAVARTIQTLVMESALDALDLVKPFARDARSSYFAGQLFTKRNWRDSDRPQIKAQHEQALARYRDGISTSLSSVTTDGYDSKARRHQCKATIRIESTASSQAMEARAVAYTVQATAKSGEFQVEIAEVDKFITLVSKDATDYVVNAIAKGVAPTPEPSMPVAQPAESERSN